MDFVIFYTPCIPMVVTQEKCSYKHLVRTLVAISTQIWPDFYLICW